MICEEHISKLGFIQMKKSALQDDTMARMKSQINEKKNICKAGVQSRTYIQNT